MTHSRKKTDRVLTSTVSLVVLQMDCFTCGARVQQDQRGRRRPRARVRGKRDRCARPLCVNPLAPTTPCVLVGYLARNFDVYEVRELTPVPLAGETFDNLRFFATLDLANSWTSLTRTSSSISQFQRTTLENFPKSIKTN